MTTYKTILTDYGIARDAASIATGVPINLTHMAVGDGGGSPVTPDPTMTSLVNEVFRTTVNVIVQDPAHPENFYIEMLIPAATGGWTIREFSILDDSDKMVGIGNFPDYYKTVPSDGATSDFVIRAVLTVSNADVISIVFDPAVVIATRQWVEDNVTPCLIFPGGTTGQIMRKVSNTCGDTEWANPTDVNVIVDVVQELQTSGASQATFTLATCTTDGLTVHVAGDLIPKRVGAGGWTEIDATHILLGTALTAGIEVIFLQNEPANALTVPLDRNLNLSDLQSVATARANLSVYSKTESDQINPAGAVAFFAMSAQPTGWLKCNGATISRTVYARLFAAIGTTFGAGDGSTTFKLPDLRGEFVRTWDDGRGVDTGRAFGSYQSGQNAAHTHTGTSNLIGDHFHGGSTATVLPHTHSGSTDTEAAHNHTDGVHTILLKPPYVGSLTGSDTANSGSEQAVGPGDGGAIIPSGAHSHTVSTNPSGSHNHTLTTSTAGAHQHTLTLSSSGGSDIRPSNLALLACVRY